MSIQVTHQSKYRVTLSAIHENNNHRITITINGISSSPPLHCPRPVMHKWTNHNHLWKTVGLRKPRAVPSTTSDDSRNKFKTGAVSS